MGWAEPGRAVRPGVMSECRSTGVTPAPRGRSPPAPPGAAMAAAPRPAPHPQQQHPEQRRAADIIRLLTLYRPLLDAFIIDFFTEDLWAQLPPAWQPALASASPAQLAGLLRGHGGPGAAWPLSLLAFAAAARALAFPRGCPGGSPRPPCQSSHLHPLLRRHVKPKKQHEIQRLGKLLQRLSQATSCERVVDIGAGQGHLSRFLAFGLGLSVTAVESDGRLSGLAERFDQELLQELGKMRGLGHQRPPRRCRNPPVHPLTPRAPRHVAGRLDPAAPWREFLLPPDPPGPGSAAQNPLGGPGGSEDGGRVLLTGLHACGDLGPALLCHFARSPAVAAVALAGCCYMKLSTAPQPPGCPLGYPLSASVAALPGHQLSYRAREAACHALEEYEGRLRGGSAHLRAHCYRAVLESLIRTADPGKRHLGLQPGRKAHALGFPQYAHLGLPLAGLDPAGVPLDSGAVGAMLEQQHKVVAFCTLGQLLAPVVETLILLDRLLYLREQGFHCALVPLFNPRFSPRNLVLVAARTPLATVVARLDKDSKDGDSSEDEDLREAESPREGQSPHSPGHRPQ
ncbi:methyltransferase-like protein 25B isoform X1 [Corvus hawaiiensis]|uniref:methyltransferase-like protein 25B isoform X1 n=1 Tax=Corvus hawaiiensis TaxID=134902 RepID=UPI0020192878|nr:methyltransferase-like protein 25B isoform X1 [Corvus hawaiiensis]